MTLTGDRIGQPMSRRLRTAPCWPCPSEDMTGFIGVMGRVIERERAGPPGRRQPAGPRASGARTATSRSIDDATGMVTELIGYGADNVAAFARLLD